MSANPLLDLMRRGESGAAGYNAYNRGTYVDASGRQHIRGADHPIDFSKLTVGQVQAMQRLPGTHPDRLFAVGKYQIIPDTLAGAVAAMGLPPEMPFTPQLQDRILSDYLIVQKRPAVHDFIVGKPGVSLQDAQHALASEWASFGDPAKGGQSHYPPPNYASITLDQSATALTAMRDGYRTAVAHGASPTEAWAAVTGVAVAPTRDVRVSRTGVASPAHANARSTALADGALKLGENGPAVKELQSALARLGYNDAKGHPVRADGVFGENTLEAVQAFQRAHGLSGNGVYGPTAQAALHEANLALVTAPGHPHHALYEQVLGGVLEAEKQRGMAPGPHNERLAAALTVEAIRKSIAQVDRVEITADGQLARVVAFSSGRDAPALNPVTDAISVLEAMQRSVAESSRQMHEVATNVRAP